MTKTFDFVEFDENSFLQQKVAILQLLIFYSKIMWLYDKRLQLYKTDKCFQYKVMILSQKVANIQK